MTDRRPTPAEVAAVYGPGVDIPPETLLLEAKMAHLAERVDHLETANVELRRRLTDRDIAIAELQRSRRAAHRRRRGHRNMSVIDCPRCGPMPSFEDGRCLMCGMTADTEGPAPRRLMFSISADDPETWAAGT